METNRDLASRHSELIADADSIKQELEQLRAQSREREAAIQADKAVIKTEFAELKQAEIRKNRGTSALVPVAARVSPAEFKQMQQAFADKEEQLGVLLRQQGELSEHITFLQNNLNEINHRVVRIKEVLVDDFAAEQAAAVAKLAAEPLNRLIACLVVKEGRQPHPGAQAQYRKVLFAAMGEAIYKQAVKNLDASDFGIPNVRQARQQIAPLIEQMEASV